MNMDMDMDAFADSAVERAANGGVIDNSEQWPPQHIAHYDYSDHNQAPNKSKGGDVNLNDDGSFVDMNLDEDPMLGDIKSAEEQGLLSGDMIDVADEYKAKPKRINNLLNSGKPNKSKRGKRGNNGGNIQRDIMMKQANGIKAAFRDKLSSQTKSQMNKYNAPSLESNLGISAWCIALFYWIPIRYLCWVGSIALFICPFIDVRWQNNMTFVEWLLYWYIQLFAIVAIFVESPTWILTRRIQLGIYSWCRILRRTWGRAIFYISVSLLTFAELQGGTRFTFSMFAGIYMTLLSFIMFMFSVLAAKQYRLMYWYMASGGNLNGKDIKIVGDEYQDENGENKNIEYNKLVSRVASYFNELDHDKDGKIGATELHSFAEQALRRNLSNSERYTLQAFLDCSCNGHISKHDWIKQFCDYGPVKFL